MDDNLPIGLHIQRQLSGNEHALQFLTTLYQSNNEDEIVIENMDNASKITTRLQFMIN